MNYRFSLLILSLGVDLALGQFLPQGILSAAQKAQRAQDPVYLQLRNIVPSRSGCDLYTDGDCGPASATPTRLRYLETMS